MKNSNFNRLSLLVGALGLIAVAAAQGCSSDDNQQTPGAGAAGMSGSTGSSGSGEGGAAGTPSTGEGGAAGTPSTGEGGAAGSGEGGAAGGDPCLGPDGCYSCTPSTNAQFLNACVPGGCPATFDNSTLSQLGPNGELPDLP